MKLSHEGTQFSHLQITRSSIFHKIIIGEEITRGDEAKYILVRYFGFINEHKMSLIVKVSVSREAYQMMELLSSINANMSIRHEWMI